MPVTSRNSWDKVKDGEQWSQTARVYKQGGGEVEENCSLTGIHHRKWEGRQRLTLDFEGGFKV